MIRRTQEHRHQMRLDQQVDDALAYLDVIASGLWPAMQLPMLEEIKDAVVTAASHAEIESTVRGWENAWIRRAEEDAEDLARLVTRECRVQAGMKLKGSQGSLEKMMQPFRSGT